MKIKIHAAYILTLVALWSAAPADGANGWSYYLFSLPIPMGQMVPLYNHRISTRKYASYLWRLRKVSETVRLKQELNIPTGGGIRQIQLWPSTALMEVSAWPTRFSAWPTWYGNHADINARKWNSRFVLSLIDLRQPRSPVSLWLHYGRVDLISNPRGAMCLIVHGNYPPFSVALGSGEVKKMRLPDVALVHDIFNGGPSEQMAGLVWAVIGKGGKLRLRPLGGESSGHVNHAHLLPTPWRIPPKALYKFAGFSAKYTWVAANTPAALVVARPNINSKGKVQWTKICLLVFNKVSKSWSVHVFNSGSNFRLWSFGPWIVVRLYGPDNKFESAATGMYWFFNSASGQSWQQSLGGPKAWMLCINNHRALVRKGDKIFRYSVHANHLANRQVLLRDKRLRYVYWACPVPKPQPPGVRHRFRFFWERPDYKLPKALQPPIQHPPSTTMWKKKTGNNK